VEPRDNELSSRQLSDDAGREKLSLEPVRQSLLDAGYYAYTTIDEQNRWSIAVDDETGRVDVHIGRDGLEVVLWASSPGLFADEDNEWRRQSRARLVRMRLPAINRGLLEPNQSATWDETEQGVAVTETYELPFTRGEDIGTFVREHLPKLEDVLIMIERQLA
jgi:hypothetical protein